MILVTPKQEVEPKSEWFCGVKFFRSKFKVECENGVWTKIRFLASGFLFTCGNFTSILQFFRFFGSDFFLNGFLNPFIVRSWSSFLFSQWKFFELYVRTCPAMFFNQFYWSDFWSGNETREKIWSDFGAEQKWRAEWKESGFCSHRCFWESEKLMCEKIFSKRANFFLFTCGF